MTKMIYRFGPDRADGRAEQRDLLGGKGANLAEMANLGIPVPPGFTITTELCLQYFAAGRQVPAGLEQEVRQSLRWLEEVTGKRFGDPENPLLVSVRSGSRASMPGMMDTILNLGLSDQAVEGLARRSQNRRFAFDAYRRLIGMYANVVLSVKGSIFETPLAEARRAVALQQGIDAPRDAERLATLIPDSMLGAAELETVVREYKAIVHDKTGQDFPNDPFEQLLGAIRAVFDSWHNDRAKLYRKMHDIPESWGTAVNVQSMVFGNLGDTSATGVAFTRDPSTGEHRFFGEWLPNAQGEDVVAGIRTPRPLSKTASTNGQSLEEALPKSYAELFQIQEKLERHFRDMQDIEFTIEDGRLFMLQTRVGKRAGRASVRIAVELVREGLISTEDAIRRVDPGRLEELLFPSIDPKAPEKPIATGLPASPGAVTGNAVFSADEAEHRAESGEAVILVRIETSPEDLHGMKAARGILTARGGATSHAAVVARGMGRTCVVGCSALSVDYELQMATVRGGDQDIVIRLGETITIDGSSGGVYVGNVAKIEPELGGELAELLTWADQVRRLKIRANADTPAQAQKARELGAEGIGLCRTEHMFFDEARILAVREMILAQDTAARERALEKLLPFQVGDFEELFRAMAGLPVNIRLLDPPLHEFLPVEIHQVESVAEVLRVQPEEIVRKVQELHEFNPMLGHRGCRLAVTYPEIYAMQVRAILQAACSVRKEGVEVLPEIMIPLAFSDAELVKMRAIVDEVSAKVFAGAGTSVPFKFGTMIELPRAALCAAELARTAEFFSFGTNDLTQTALGLSRDDAGKFLPAYIAAGILPCDPFVSMDRDGVGALVRIAVSEGKRVRPELSIGICGEHGGDPASIRFFEEVGLGYVSCSPFRVPIARLAAAQAALTKRAQN
jgi:pyruvate,orthophosphate dikinase